MQRDAIDLFLQPGEYFVGDAAFRVRTLLGSCVSVTLWHPRHRIGAMSHFLLARRGANRPDDGTHDARYGEEALHLMLTEIKQMSVDIRECEAKIFGGGDMFPDQAGPGRLNVGRRNGEAARSLLQEHAIPVVSESLFGIGHRQIVFDIHTGDVWMRQVPQG